MWYGQSGINRDGEHIYYSYCNMEKKIEPLVLFLMEHEGHKLHSSSGYAGDYSGIDTDDYEEVDYNSYLNKPLEKD